MMKNYNYLFHTSDISLASSSSFLFWSSIILSLMASNVAVTTSVFPVPPRPEMTVIALDRIFSAAERCFGSSRTREKRGLG